MDNPTDNYQLKGNPGQAIMKKMGWIEGGGLGVRSQGIVDPIIPRLKNDTTGIGFTGGHFCERNKQAKKNPTQQAKKNPKEQANKNPKQQANKNLTQQAKKNRKQQAKKNPKQAKKNPKPKKLKQLHDRVSKEKCTSAKMKTIQDKYTWLKSDQHSQYRNTEIKNKNSENGNFCGGFAHQDMILNYTTHDNAEKYQPQIPGICNKYTWLNPDQHCRSRNTESKISENRNCCGGFAYQDMILNYTTHDNAEKYQPQIPGRCNKYTWLKSDQHSQYRNTEIKIKNSENGNFCGGFAHQDMILNYTVHDNAEKYQPQIPGRCSINFNNKNSGFHDPKIPDNNNCNNSKLITPSAIGTGIYGNPEYHNGCPRGNWWKDDFDM